MSGIRVTYSGLISLSVRLSSIVTGLAFTLITTRELTQAELGTWGVISGIFVYVVAVHPIITYWATRETARGERSGRTAFLSSSAFSVIGLSIYITMAVFVSSQSDADFGMMIFAAILIPLVFLNDSVTAISMGKKPQIVSYGFLAFEVTKIPFGLVFIYFMQMGFEGAVLAISVAYVPSIAIMGIKMRHVISGSFDVGFVKKWSRLFWLPLYRNIPPLLSTSDVIVFSTITGSVSGVAYYTVARTIGFLANHAGTFSDALYPKLLESGKHHFLGENLIKLFYFSFPLVGLSMALAEPGLFALNPIYAVAAPVVILLALRSFLITFGNTLFHALQGVENVDVNKNSTFRDYTKSKLVLYPTLQLIRSAVYFGSLAIILYLTHSDVEDIRLVVYWSAVGLVVEIPLAVYIYRLVRKNMQFVIDVRSTIKYMFSAALIFGIMHIMVSEFLEYNAGIFEFLPQLMGVAVAGGLGYIGMTYVIDGRTRTLIKAVINEILPKKP